MTTDNTKSRWTVLQRVSNTKSLCRCVCGTERVVQSFDVKSGKSLSCGCFHREKITKHGLCESRIYSTWKSMIARCERKSQIGFENYGGRGIKVCGRWHKFENFLEDMGQPPSAQHTLERHKNEKGYSPSNCCWATRKQQARNRRNNRILEFRGEKRCVSEWAEIFKLTHAAIQERLHRGWSIEKALNTRPMSNGKNQQKEFANG